MNAAGQGIPLRDIHAAPAPEWWPPAPGWWVVAVLLMILLAWLGWRAWIIWRRKALSRRIVGELSELHIQWTSHGQDERLLADLSAFLRRVGLAVAGPSVAGITGREWLEKLEQFAGASGLLTTGPAAALVDAPYQRAGQRDVNEIYQVVHRYVQLVSERIARQQAP